MKNSGDTENELIRGILYKKYFEVFDELVKSYIEVFN